MILEFVRGDKVTNDDDLFGFFAFGSGLKTSNEQIMTVT